MQLVLAEFDRQLDKFDQRARALSAQALQDVERDSDERAAMTILVSGTLESFLRDVTREYLDAVCARGARFEALPESLRKSHYEDGAHHLLKVVKQDWAEIKAGRAVDFAAAADVCRRLHSASGLSYELLWEGIARTESNADPETIKKILARLDVDKPWVTIDGKIPPGMHALPAGAFRLNKLSADVRALRDARNRCAHSTKAPAPAWSLLIEYIASLKAVGKGLVEALNERLGAMPS